MAVQARVVATAAGKQVIEASFRLGTEVVDPKRVGVSASRMAQFSPGHGMRGGSEGRAT